MDMNDIKQEAIFEDKEWWEEEWQNMPEFVQKDLTPAKTLYVHFRNLEDIETFAQLIGQTVTELTSKKARYHYP